MKLEHVNLVVSDINAMLKFYQAAFPYWSIRSGGGKEPDMANQDAGYILVITINILL